MSSKQTLFNTEMVKAILDGRKTQTRRVVNLKNNDLIFTGFVMSSATKNKKGCCAFGKSKECDLEFIKPKYKVGDVLWVREPVKVTKACNDTLKMEFEYLSNGTKKIIDIPKKYLDEYDFIKNNCFLAKLNQLHYDKAYIGVPNGCLKEMARIFLKVTNVRVERLQDIRVRDIEKETGWKREKYSYSNKNRAFYKDYRDLWNSTAKDGYKWENNPYVFVYEFKRVEKQ